MKKITFYYHSLIIISVFCFFSSCVSSQNIVPVKGNGEAISKDYNVSGFNKIDVSGGFDVILSQGEGEGVVLNAQENLYKYIHVEVEGNMLRIYTDRNIMPTRPLKARISFKNMDYLEVSGGGDVTAENTIDVSDLSIKLSGGGDISAKLNNESLSCVVSGGGDVQFSGKAVKFQIEMSGGGDLHSTLDMSEASCHLSGGGNMELISREKLNETEIGLTGGGDLHADLNTQSLICIISGGGDANILGETDLLKITVSGGGDINAGSFRSHSAVIDASGGSDVHVSASEEIKGNISGGGDLYYGGSPEIVTIDARGGSEVHKE